jgi:hypothetical protein
MWHQPENEQFTEELFLAGERVSPGLYRQIDREREIHLPSEDHLPASLDGQVACYVRVRTWGQMLREEEKLTLATHLSLGLGRDING